MDLARVDQIAKAVLYEGYMLYPYRPSSVKNQQRFNFGVLYPEAYSDLQDGADPCIMMIECLVSSGAGALIGGMLRFLQVQTRSTRQDNQNGEWQEVIERGISIPECCVDTLCRGKNIHKFSFEPQTQIMTGSDFAEVKFRQESIEGFIQVSAERILDTLIKVRIVVQNITPIDPKGSTRDEILKHSLVSTHVVLGVQGGEFVSLLEPPNETQDFAAQCNNVGAWPVLVGEPGQRDTLLASPIILYDYPQIAPESAGDLFDGTEIDEILSLRIMTLTDEEKREIRESDQRARQILERTDSMPPEQFMKLHGAVRGMRPLKEEPL